MAKESIGERAAQAIEARAAANGTSLSAEMELLGVCRKTLGDWRSRGRNPQGYYLQQMALHGYDIYYILTGETKHEN